MSSVPLVSVLMPAYNHERYVRAAADSVLGQSHADLELVAVDDASSDGTWAALTAIDDRRLRAVRHDANRGAHATLNEALGLARGRYLAIINSDDLFDPHRLERLLAAVAAAGDGPAWAFSDVAFMDGDGQPAGGHARAGDYARLRDRCAGLADGAWFLAGNPAISTSNLFFSRSLLDRVGGFRPLRYTHDWDWALRAARVAKPVWLRQQLLRYRVHAANTLAEDDGWRHIHENSYVQASALLTMAGRGDEAAARAACQALLGNDSCHPAALACFLALGIAGVDDGRLLDLAGEGAPPWLLEELARPAGLPQAVFRSGRWLAGREEALAAQAALVDERWRIIQQMSEEVANRDRWIADQTALIADKDRCIAAQAAMVEERWNIIQHMNGEIARRDEDIAARDGRLAGLQADLDRLNAHPVIRAARVVGRLFGRRA